MNREEFLAHIAGTFAKAYEIIKKKNSDYAGHGDPFKNFKNATLAGVSVEQAILVRKSDKLSRMSTLLAKESVGEDRAVADEKFEDTCIDDIAYDALMLAYRASKK